MMVIIVTVITQGARIDSDLKGPLRGSLFVNDGFFQAVGVISFGMLDSTLSHARAMLILRSIRVPPQQSSDIRLLEEAYPGPVCEGYAFLYKHFDGCMHGDGARGISYVRRQN